MAQDHISALIVPDICLIHCFKSGGEGFGFQLTSGAMICTDEADLCLDLVDYINALRIVIVIHGNIIQRKETLTAKHAKLAYLKRRLMSFAAIIIEITIHDERKGGGISTL